MRTHLDETRIVTGQLVDELGGAEVVLADTLLQLELFDRVVRRAGGEHWWTGRTDNSGLGTMRHA